MAGTRNLYCGRYDAMAATAGLVWVGVAWHDAEVPPLPEGMMWLAYVVLVAAAITAWVSSFASVVIWTKDQPWPARRRWRYVGPLLLLTLAVAVLGGISLTHGGFGGFFAAIGIALSVPNMLITARHTLLVQPTNYGADLRARFAEVQAARERRRHPTPDTTDKQPHP